MKTTIKVQKPENKQFTQVMVIVFTAVFGLILTSSAKDNATLLASANQAFISHPSVKANAFPAFRIETATEKSLEIESWMTDSKFFEPALSYSEEKDNPLKLEEWMTNDLNFGAAEVLFAEETENEMQIESWMTDDYFWRN